MKVSIDNVSMHEASADRPSFQRRRKLIKPGLQLRLIASFGLLSALGFLLQALFTAQLLAERVNGESGLRSDAIPDIVWTCLWYSFLCFMPLTIAVGILATFRLAGPIYRFEQHLVDVARGKDMGPCKIRRGDELQELCDRINEAVGALRSLPGARFESVTPPARTERAA